MIKLNAWGELMASKRVVVFISELDGRPVSAYLFGYFNHRAYGMVSGSTDRGNSCCAPVHLTWSAIQWFKQDGATQLSLGGAKEDERGLRHFKRRFGALETVQPSGRKTLSAFGTWLARCRGAARWRS
jgi:lipid II:glycine glycyltransferase (peptidoglycan interpeptide bridge formation enzyme)